MVEPSGGASGQASDIAIHAREILRVRDVLTRIYQRHCGKEGESVHDGVDRFVMCHELKCVSRVRLLHLAPFVEKALERDYFLTGELICDMWRFWA